MSLEIGKTYKNKQSDRTVVILGRLDTLAKEGCLLAEDKLYGIILPIFNENPDNWELLPNSPSVKDIINERRINKHEYNTTEKG